MNQLRVSIQIAVIGIAVAAMMSACSSLQKVIDAKSRWQSDYLHLEKRQVPPLEQRRYLPAHQIYYSFSNDSENLYVMLEVVNKPVVAKMLFAGATLWINTKGKVKETMGLKYPLGMKGLEDGGLPKMDSGQRIKTLIANKKRLKLIGIRAKKTAEINHLEPGAPNAVIWIDDRSGHLIYLARIPLHTIGIEEGNLKNKIAVGFETGSLDRPDSQAKMRGMRSTRRRRPSRRGRTQRNKSTSELTHSTEFWFRFSLSAE